MNHINSTHKHRAQLHGAMAAKARELGEPVVFLWVCHDPDCGLGPVSRMPRRRR
jgi:hypothetical protein